MYIQKLKSSILCITLTVFTVLFIAGCQNPVNNSTQPITVTFNANGGNGTMETLVYTGTSFIELPVNTFISPDGMIFSGWAQNPSGEIVYDDRGEYKVHANDELYAVWKTAYSIENYTQTDVFEIYSPAQLLQIVDIAATQDSRGRYIYEFADPNGNNKKTIKLMRDIDMKHILDFRGIGANAEHDPTYFFGGIFDGNSKVLKNLTIMYTADTPGWVGLITNGFGAVVKNLGIKNGSISNPANASVAVGSIFGNAHTVTIENVYNHADVSNTNTIVGGLVGQMDGTSIIQNSYNAGNVTMGNGSNASAAGGLVGSYGVTMGTRAEIINSYNIGSVVNHSAHNDSIAGGIAGFHKAGSITNTYNIGSISGEAPQQAGISVYFGITNPSLQENFILKSVASDPNATELLPHDFASEETFANWNLSSVWNIKPSLPTVNGVNARPVLQDIGEGK